MKMPTPPPQMPPIPPLPPMPRPPMPPPVPPEVCDDFDELPTRCPDLSDMDYTMAVFTFGGYPQIPYEQAESELLHQVRAFTPFGWVCAAAIWVLSRRLTHQLDNLGIFTADDAVRHANEGLKDGSIKRRSTAQYAA